jgi:hypothetical protein
MVDRISLESIKVKAMAEAMRIAFDALGRGDDDCDDAQAAYEGFGYIAEVIQQKVDAMRNDALAIPELLSRARA